MSYSDGKVSKRQIENVIDSLELLLEMMDQYEVDEVKTESNTYFCNGHQFVSFNSIGFLPLLEDYEDLVLAEVDDEEEDE